MDSRNLLSIPLVIAVAAFAWGETATPVQRAKPPATTWNKSAAKAFRDDAFAELEGERPDFAAVGKTSGGATGPAGGAAPVAANGGGGGFRWSGLVSEETLTDEVKGMRGVLSTAVASQSDFKGGGYEVAREAFSTVAVCFGVIAAYDQQIRWKRDAETARDLFARVGFNCKVGTDQSFNESKLRFADLDSLLNGGSPSARPEREEDFRWSQTAGRPALMNRLETAEAKLTAGGASKSDFDKAIDRVVHDAEIVAMIGEVIQLPEFEYFDDDTYRGYASAMRDAAVGVREAARKKDYEAARASLGALKKSCDSCHGDYRN